TISRSAALMQAVGFSSLIIFTLFSTLGLILRLKLSWQTITSTLDFQKKFHQPKLFLVHFFTFGKVIDKNTRKPVSAATISISDQVSGKIIWTGKTDHKGMFKYTHKQQSQLHVV